MRFPIAFGRTKPVLIATGMRPAVGYVDVDDREIRVRMGWAFQATIARPSITDVELLENKVISIGVHGWRGRWLVNGAGDRLVRLTIDPAVRARATGMPIKLRELTLSLEDREEFARMLAAG